MRNSAIKAALSLSISCGVLMMGGSANAFVLKNYNSGLCLAAWGGNTSPGTSLIQWNCDHTESQVWVPSSFYSSSTRLLNFDENMCIGVENASTSNGASLILWSCNGANDQQWRFTKQAGHTMPGARDCYFVQNVNSSKLMAVMLSSTQPGAEVIQYSSGSSPTNDAYWCVVDQVIY